MIEEDIQEIIRFLDENFSHRISENPAEPWSEDCNDCGQSRYGNRWCNSLIAKVKKEKP